MVLKVVLWLCKDFMCRKCLLKYLGIMGFRFVISFKWFREKVLYCFWNFFGRLKLFLKYVKKKKKVLYLVLVVGNVLRRVGVLNYKKSWWGCNFKFFILYLVCVDYCVYKWLYIKLNRFIYINRYMEWYFNISIVRD